ncbi:hypothetical protein SUGI_0720290 [Cryptomeria japonica]|nr:hypothetical protein SUGI_0720290 [Cryptomeria japonica]
MAGSREGMEGAYLTCKICPYFPIQLEEAGATGEARAPGAEAGMTIEQVATDPEAIAQAWSTPFFEGFRDRCHSPSWVKSNYGVDKCDIGIGFGHFLIAIEDMGL